MKKLLFVIVLLVIIGLTLMMTCPDKDVHYEALKGVTSEVINAEMNESKVETTMASIGTVLAVNVVDAYLKSNLIVRDHTFYNVGSLTKETSEWCRLVYSIMSTRLTKKLPVKSLRINCH